MPAISRKGDSLSTGHACTGTTTLDTPGQSTVRANSILIARVGDPTVSHPFPPVPACGPHVANVNVGSGTVRVSGASVLSPILATNAPETLTVPLPTLTFAT
jgi:uncharacterized Zn-binding protein involved in type VI secretion